MVERKAYNFSKFGDQWVAQEMDTNTGEMADEMLGLIGPMCWPGLKIIFWPITLTYYLYKYLTRPKE